MPIPNCYTLGPNNDGLAVLRPGFALSDNLGRQSLLLVGAGKKYHIPIHSRLTRYGVTGDNVLLEAGLPEDRSTTAVPNLSLVERNGRGSTLLLVKSIPGITLSTCGTQKPHFKVSRLWIGADRATLNYAGLRVPPECQVGAHDTSQKTQLFSLSYGESVFFVDINKEVTTLVAGEAGTKPTMVRASNGDVATYVLDEAKLRGRSSRSTMGWCFYALQELGCQKQIDEFQQLFPGFHAKPK